MRSGFDKNLIEKILGGAPKFSIAELEEKYPMRGLAEGAEITRFAPSPTGFMHIGGLYQMLIDKKIAKQTGGIFFLRIEDTDTKREVDGAVSLILNSAKQFDLMPDEMPGLIEYAPYSSIYAPAMEKMHKGYLPGIGAYAPYSQSERKDIYHSVASELLERGAAYPCFMSAEDMELTRSEQKNLGLPTGIYGQWARDRNIMPEVVAERLLAGEKPTIRLYSEGDPAKKIYCKDVVRGSIAFPEDDEDVVLIKSDDGLPTYHFAHIVDDHFMRTTLVIRGEEWLSSLPKHIQMFGVLGWNPPRYIHTSTLDKIDDETGKQRKLSKRKDPEASVERFVADGWPIEAVLEYLFNIASSGYEEAKAKGQAATIWDWELKPKKIPMSGALFDMKKLEWWAKEFIATLPLNELTKRVVDWANEFGTAVKDIEYLKSILGIERDNPKRVRKDFITWKQTLENIAFFFDDGFVAQPGNEITKEFLAVYNPADTKDEWWAKVQGIAEKLGVKNGDVAMALRVALSGREQTPDLYSMISVMGEDRVKRRLK
ncbi:MAG: glutamate--tRNA ligase [Rickettsiales bacterium]|jgi:glutamyl-tRNA synthetase|nr:glutamate--tRNA ligase [Rickettsiales bacterium]